MVTIMTIGAIALLVSWLQAAIEVIIEEIKK